MPDVVRPGALVLVTPPPTPNGPLHVGHLSGPYLAADIAARAARAEGRDVRTVCGLDVHQNWVPARAEALGEPVGETTARFSALVKAAFAAARIEYDVFTEPEHDMAYQDYIPALLRELVASGAAAEAKTTLWACAQCDRTLHHVRVSGSCPTCGEGACGGTCEGCGGFLRAGDLLDASSTCCGASLRAVAATVPVLRLEDYRSRLAEIWTRVAPPGRVGDVLARLLADGLPEVPLAYPTDWGLRLGGTDAGEDGGLRVDVWAELALNYLASIARSFDPAAATLADCATAWAEVDQACTFLGMDNLFYYAALVPAVLLAAGVPGEKVGPLVVNEFYRLDGRKFSTSRSHAIWVDEFLAAEDVPSVRAYLCWDRPDRTGTDFTRATYDAFRERYLAALAADDTDTDAGPPDPGLSALELARAAHALRPGSQDLPLAVRCLLAAGPATNERARALLSCVTGEG